MENRSQRQHQPSLNQKLLKGLADEARVEARVPWGTLTPGVKTIAKTLKNT